VPFPAKPLRERKVRSREKRSPALMYQLWGSDKGRKLWNMRRLSLPVCDKEARWQTGLQKGLYYDNRKAEMTPMDRGGGRQGGKDSLTEYKTRPN